MDAAQADGDEKLHSKNAVSKMWVHRSFYSEGTKEFFLWLIASAASAFAASACSSSDQSQLKPVNKDGESPPGMARTK